jgi:lipoprotein-releasing system permease protein
MYKLLLCWRYLRTRFLAFVCIVSVMLGVATLIVVNSVMSGFSTKLKDRLHKMLSDVVIESPNINGFPIPADDMLTRIRNAPVGKLIEAMAPTIETVAMIQYRFPNGENDIRPVKIIGCNPKQLSAVGGLNQYFLDPKRQADPSFKITHEARSRFDFLYPEEKQPILPNYARVNEDLPPIDKPEMKPRDPQGIIVGYAMATFRDTDPVTKEPMDQFLLFPGDMVQVMTIGVGKDRPEPVHSHFVICDYIKTELGEQDANFIFVDLEYLQQLRGMSGRASTIQIKLKNEGDANNVVAQLKELFPNKYMYTIQRWEDKQSGILAAIDIERGILNVLLFLIVGVAGFGILAIFSMIVVEKTRDIGIMKSLGASNRGIMMIFLGYGFMLGTIGATLGTILGIAFTNNINIIEKWLSRLTGQEIFPRNVYYFDSIPTNMVSWNIGLIDVGAIAIAVFFSILPALRAAMLNPVRALRYE